MLNYRMLESFQMELVLHQNFFDFFDEHRYNTDDCQLMYRMEAFSKAKVSQCAVAITVCCSYHSVL